MYQIYLLSELLLFLFGCFMLLDDFGTRFPVLYSLSNILNTNRSFRLFILIIDFIVFTLMLIFPVSPGPAVFGDLFPLLGILSLEICLIYCFSGGGIKKELPQRIKKLIGYYSLIICFVHFLIPNVILL